jgi:hypothetical protein
MAPRYEQRQRAVIRLSLRDDLYACLARRLMLSTSKRPSLQYA